VPAVVLSRLELDPSQALRRAPPRPPYWRQPGYEEQFDFLTVFYDCFASPDGRSWIMIGPPLANLEADVIAEIKRAFFHDGSPARLLVRNERHVSTVRLASRKAAVPLGGAVFVQQRLALQPNFSDWFRGRKVILTKTKDNELVWIRDWVQFYARKHGADAVLIYSNSTAADSCAEIADAIRPVDGIAVAVVVHWPYPFGPDGGEHAQWDSDFCEYGILEHARHRFLATAAAVVSGDVDELIITRNGSSVFDLAGRSSTGYLSFAGQWIENAAMPRDGMRRHAHYRYRAREPQEGAERKWVTVPARCPPESQWRVHSVTSMQADRELSALVAIRHFKAINTNWKVRRWVPELPDERRHEVDEELLPWLDIFQDGDEA
jgi:hypothetical protein